MELEVIKEIETYTVKPVKDLYLQIQEGKVKRRTILKLISRIQAGSFLSEANLLLIEILFPKNSISQRIEKARNKWDKFLDLYDLNSSIDSGNTLPQELKDEINSFIYKSIVKDIKEDYLFETLNSAKVKMLHTKLSKELAYSKSSYEQRDAASTIIAILDGEIEYSKIKVASKFKRFVDIKDELLQLDKNDTYLMQKVQDILFMHIMVKEK